MRTAISRASNQAGSVYKEFPTLRFEGLNNRDLSIHIGDNQAQDLMNVNFDINGGLQKKNGYIKYSAIDTNPVKSTFAFNKSDGTKYVIAASGTSIFNVTNGIAVSIKTGLTSGQRFTAAVYKDTIYMVNGTDGVMKWDGATFATISGLPFANCKYIVLHKNRMYFSGDPVNPSRVWFSELGDQENVQALDFIDINTNDGDLIMSLVEHMDNLVVIKQNSLKVLTGTGPQAYTVVDEYLTKGTVSHWSVISILGELYYLSREGVYMFNGKVSILVSDDIKGSVFGLNGNVGWSSKYLTNACAVNYNNKYWLALTEGTGVTNNRIYILDYTHRTKLSPDGVWTRYDTPVSSFCLSQNSTTLATILLTGDPSSGLVYQQDTGNSDNGSNINDYYHTKDYDYGAPAHYKSYKGLFFFAEQQPINYPIQIKYVLDLNKESRPINLNLGGTSAGYFGTSLFGLATFGSHGNVITGTTSVSGASRYLSFIVSDNSINPFVFLGFVVRYQVKRRLT